MKIRTKIITIVPCGHQLEIWLSISSDGRITYNTEPDGYAASRGGSKHCEKEISLKDVSGTHYESGRPLVEMVKEVLVEFGCNVPDPHEEILQLAQDHISAVLIALDEVVDLMETGIELTTDELDQMVGALRDAFHATESAMSKTSRKREFKFSRSEKG